MAKEAQTGPRWTAGARVPGARRCCACWGGGALACAREISRVLWHRHSCLYSTTTLPWKLLTPPVYPTAENRGNNKAADRKVRGLIAMLLGWYRNTYSLAGVTFFLTLVPHGHLLSWPPLWNFRAAAGAEGWKLAGPGPCASVLPASAGGSATFSFVSSD